MNVFLAVVITLVAGVVNGSFALPTKYIREWQFENIWLHFSFWCYLIMPWLIIILIDHTVINFYLKISSNQFLTLMIGGIIFGIGQVCFVQALKMIGFGLSFVINIGLGTGLGFLLPLVILHTSQVFTPFGYMTLLGLFLIIGGLLLSYHAGKQRDIHRRTMQMEDSPAQHYHVGVLLAVIAGFCSGCQNFTFAMTNHLQALALIAGIRPVAASIIIWPIFLSFTCLVFSVYMFYLHYKNRSFANFRSQQTGKNILMTFAMGVAWFLSLLLYSVAAMMIGNLGPIIAWPLFMVLIILTSNFWGWRHHEWAHTTPAIVNKALKAIGLLILSVIVLGFSAVFST